MVALLAVIVAAVVFSINQLQLSESVVTQPVPKEKPEVTHTEIIRMPEADDRQPSYASVNQEAVLKNVRREGKTYVSTALGNLTGRAAKKDWGIKGIANFNYMWGVQSTSYIEKNDGTTIVEVRSFDKVAETVTVNDVGVSLDLPDEVAANLDFLFNLASETLVGVPVGPWVSIINKRTLKIPDVVMDIMHRHNILPADVDPKQMAGKMTMFTQPKGKYLLEGKKVRITFIDGQGIVSIEPLGCELTDSEVEVIKRSNFVMDHYVMPDREVAVDESWKVPGNVFGGVVDPRLSGKLDGEVTITRKDDIPLENSDYARRLAISGGKIQFVSQENNGRRVGKLTNITGSSIIPASHNVVTKAELSGVAEYDEVSTNHLLFEARMNVKPTFKVKYECQVKD